MSQHFIEPDESQLLVAAHDTVERFAHVLDSGLRFGVSSDAARQGQQAAAGDRGPLGCAHGEELHVHNASDSPTTIELSEQAREARTPRGRGFYFDPMPRSTVGAVQTSANNEAAPASDDYVAVAQRDVDVNAEPAVEHIDAPDRADYLVVSVDDATGEFDVAVQYLDAADNVVTERNGSTDSALSSQTGATLARVAIASPLVRVRITDQSGVANTLDYNLYAR